MKVVMVVLSPDTSREKIDLSMAQLQNVGACVKLKGIPPFSHISSHYQLLTGLGPEWTAAYDEVRVEDYQVMPLEVANRLEKDLVWNIVEAMGKTSTCTNLVPTQALAQLVFVEAQDPCAVESLHQLASEQVVTLMMLSDVPVQPSKDVNVNNFLENKRLLERDADGSICWEETLAYYMGHGQIWVNLLGREPNGIVTPGQEYNELREVLIRVLREQLVDPETGTPVIESIWKKEDLYASEGTYFVHAPDLVVTFLSGYSPSSRSMQLSLEVGNEVINTSGDHTVAIGNTVMLAWGKCVKSEYSGVGRSVDVVPTVLYLLGLPLSQTLSGRILRDIFEPGFLHKHPPRYQEAASELTQEEEALLVNRLTALGYID